MPAGLDDALSCCAFWTLWRLVCFWKGLAEQLLTSVLTQHGSHCAYSRPGNTAQQAACHETAGLGDCLLSPAYGAVQVTITKLKLDKDRKALLERKGKGKEASKGKFSEKEVAAMQEVD